MQEVNLKDGELFGFVCPTYWGELPILSRTFLTNTPIRPANILVYNYLLQNKAVVWNANGRYNIDYDKTWKALEKLGADILRIQALGDVDAAEEYLTHYAVADMKSQADSRVLERAGIPVDIRFEYK